MMLTTGYLLSALLGAAAFYLATAHQRLWQAATGHARLLRAAGTVCCVLAAWLAIAALGVVAGLFSALTALMLGVIALPYLDAWRSLRRQG